MAHEFSTSYVRDAEHMLRYYKGLGERAMAQTPDEALTASLDAESNSIAIIVKHMTGNMRSRWVDFLTSDGEKPDRNRDTEFEAPPDTRAGTLAMWEQGWRYLFDALAPLTDADLGRCVMIRSQPHSVMQAIQRQMAHYSLSRGTDRLFGEAFCRRPMDVSERSAGKVGRFQCTPAGWRSAKELVLPLPHARLCRHRFKPPKTHDRQGSLPLRVWSC